MSREASYGGLSGSPASQQHHGEARGLPEPAAEKSHTSTQPGPPRVETVDARMLVVMRCVLAFSAFAIIWIDPSEPRRLVELTYASLAAYCVYSLVLAFAARRAGWPAPDRALHWIDVLFYTYLVALTEGTSSIFFHFYFFAILVASFTRGFKEGISVALASFAAFTTVGIVFAPAGDEFELNRTLIRGVYLFAFGYLMSHLGGYEIALKRRLGLLRDINTQWNPRLGADRVIHANLERLRSFYDADACLLVLKRPGDPPQCVMYNVSAKGEGRQPAVTAITESTADALLRLPATLGAVYHDPAGSLGMRVRGCSAYDFVRQAETRNCLQECEALANLLDTRAFMTAPYAQPDGTAGRLFLTSGTRSFTRTGLEFLAQASNAISTVAKSLQLVDELVSRAAEHERLAIARDLHDATIQPYIGLKLALDALKREAGEENPLAGRIGEVAEMAGTTIRDLRAYADTFRDRGSMPGTALVSRVKEQATRIARYYGIDVEVVSELEDEPQGRLVAETFYIVTEGLSNVLRHTAAKKAFVTLRRKNSCVLIEIGNETGEGFSGPLEFVPRTISERAEALGGTAAVEQRAGYTVVRVMLPT
jgi:signal transduction histidine kinase